MMATLSPYIVKASSVGSTATITKTPGGRLSLLSSDIDEDLGFLDLNDPRYDYLSGDEVWLLDDDVEYDPKIHSYAAAREWIESEPRLFEIDTYFDDAMKNSKAAAVVQTTTPTLNGYNRFEYLTKSVSRTATITKRKIGSPTAMMSMTPATSSPPATNPRYGTITKTVAQSNRTFDIQQGSGLRFTPTNTDSRVNDGRIINTNNSNNTPSLENGDDGRRYPVVNTNTITKTNRRVLNATLPNRIKCDDDDSFESDSNFNVNNNTDQEEYGTLSSDGITENHDLNRTYEIQKSDSDDTESSTSTQPSCRNYPTISRNVQTGTFLKRESSNGQQNGQMRRSPQRSNYLASSNDDLLGSDCSTMSMRSNLSMTSSITGKSEPNLIDAQTTGLSVHQPRLLGNIQAKSKFQSRLVAPTANNHPSLGISRIARPASQNGLNGTIIKKNPTVIPTATFGANQPSNAAAGGNSSKSRSFGSMNTLQQGSNQFSMPRAASQIEMRQEYDSNNLPSIIGNGKEDEEIVIRQKHPHQKLAMMATVGGLDRKSTFRVHRPSTVINVTTLFSAESSLLANRNHGVATVATEAEVTTINHKEVVSTLSNGSAATAAEDHGGSFRGDRVMMKNSNDSSRLCFVSRTNFSRMKINSDTNNNVKHYHDVEDDGGDDNNNHREIRGDGSAGTSAFMANNPTTTTNHNKQINQNISSASRIPAFLPKLSMTSIPQARSNIPVSGKDQSSHRPGLVRPGTVNGSSPTLRRSTVAYIGNHHHHLDNLSNKYK